MEKGWTKIYTTNLEHEAIIRKEVLEDHEIEVVLINKKDSSYVMIGEIELYVKQDNVLPALNLINKMKDE